MKFLRHYGRCRPGASRLVRSEPLCLYDMVGNVFEWTEDCVHNNYSGARRMARRGAQTAIAATVSSAAVLGSAIQTTSAPRIASGLPPTAGTAAWDFGSGGRFLHLESLSLAPRSETYCISVRDARRCLSAWRRRRENSLANTYPSAKPRFVMLLPREL